MTPASAKAILLRTSLFGAALVAVFALLGLRSARGERQREAKLDLRAISYAIGEFRRETGTLPVSLRELVPHWLHELRHDPWGNDYVYKIFGTRRDEEYRVLSLGRDGLLGTADDILIEDTTAQPYSVK